MSEEEDDGYDYGLSPEEMWVTKEEFSLLRVDIGLKYAELRPLAEHLRSGFSLPPEVSAVIADAIEGRPGSLCSIAAVLPTDGRPSENLHTRNIEIGLDYLKALRSATRGQAKGIKFEIALRFGVSEATVRDAIAYTRKWLKDLAEH